MQVYYISSARELARLVGIKKAPVLHHFSETVSGAATIRCFNQGENFFRKSLELIDDYSRITFHNSATMEWLCVRVNFLFNLVFFVMLVILVSLPRDTIDPSKFSHKLLILSDASTYFNSCTRNDKYFNFSFFRPCRACSNLWLKP
jgi:ABC-type multidrug transport system fused ATPase/permease subunit